MKYKNQIMIAATFVLPFLAWLIGVWVNPSGWMSDSPLVVIQLLFMLIYFYWPVMVALVLAAALFLWKRPKQAKTVLVPVVFALSVIYSLNLYLSVQAAAEDEFTG